MTVNHYILKNVWKIFYLRPTATALVNNEKFFFFDKIEQSVAAVFIEFYFEKTVEFAESQKTVFLFFARESKTFLWFSSHGELSSAEQN